MPADSNFPNLPPSPIRDDDKFIVNRDNVSHKINASDLLFYLANVDFPVVKPCDGDNDCPPGYICYNGQCVLRCDGGCGGDPNDPDYDVTDNYSCCPDGHLCVQVDDNTQVCLPYPFPCDSLPIASPCPEGFVCVGGLCFQQCNLGGICPPDHICANIDGLDVCVPYPFPCPEDGICPDGFECYNGFCLFKCEIANCPPGSNCCPPGSQCIVIEIGDPNLGGTVPKEYCVPYPFPCGSIPPYGECPPNFYCYGGMCYPICDQNEAEPCPEGFECFPVGNENNNQGQDGGPPITICLPSPPSEGLINDGKLNIVDDQNNRRIIFTANQYGDTFLKFNGIDIEGGNGGGSGSGDLSFRTLWKRVDEDKLDSDIQPTYENVDALPNGDDCHLGYDAAAEEPPSNATDTRWNGVFTRDLNISREVYGDLISYDDDRHEVGSTSKRWKTLVTHDLNIDRDVYGTLRPSGENLYQIGEEDRKWKSGHFGVGGSVHLNPSGSIGLGSAAGVGKPFQILTSNGAGQAYWDFIHFEEQTQMTVRVASTELPGPTVSGPGSPGTNDDANTIMSVDKVSKVKAPAGSGEPDLPEGPITGFRACILELHATVENSLSVDEPNGVEMKVGIKGDAVRKVDYSNFITMNKTKGTLVNAEAEVDGKTGPVTGEVQIAPHSDVATVTCFTFIDLNPLKTYTIFGCATTIAGSGCKITLGSIRGMFFS